MFFPTLCVPLFILSISCIQHFFIFSFFFTVYTGSWTFFRILFSTVYISELAPTSSVSVVDIFSMFTFYALTLFFFKKFNLPSSAFLSLLSAIPYSQTHFHFPNFSLFFSFLIIYLFLCLHFNIHILYYSSWVQNKILWMIYAKTASRSGRYYYQIQGKKKTHNKRTSKRTEYL